MLGENIKKIWIIILILLSFLSSLFPSRVEVKKNSSGKWELLVNGSPFIVKGVNYDCSKTCAGYDVNWKKQDFNNNNILDGPYEAWIDFNKNNVQDADESGIGDFRIMQEMGCNAIRDFLNSHDPDFTDWKPIYRNLYNNYNIRIMMANFFGAYGAGAEPYPTSYTNDLAKARMMDSVTNLVLEYKDEPYILMWILGNENNYSKYTYTDADQFPNEYAQFLNQAAQKVHELDPDHPVAFCNGDVNFITNYAKFATNIDIFAVNIYRGFAGFQEMWQTVKTKYDKPVLITEYGGPWESAWEDNHLVDTFEQDQVRWHQKCWQEVEYHSYTGPGYGNALGATVVHWLDRWHEHGNACSQDVGDNGGICSHGDGTDSPFLRQLRQVYYYYQEAWAGKNPETELNAKIFKTSPRNYPNPLRLSEDSRTRIYFLIKENARINLKIYDLKQNLVHEYNPKLSDYYFSFEYFWDGRDKDNKIVPSGIYFCRVQAQNQSFSEEKIFKILVEK